MKFTLTYDGELPSTGNSSRKIAKKWDIRKQISPQLKELWDTHPALRRAMQHRVIPKFCELDIGEAHHSTPVTVPVINVSENHIDLCASIKRGNVLFRPLVRDTYALACSLKIHFMRKEAVGRVYQGGDLDNRIKTLLDALSVPEPDQVISDTDTHMHCLLENDSLVTGLSVETVRLLSKPGSPENEVRLIIEVDVRITDARAYNSFFLGD